MVDTNFAKRFENATPKEIMHALTLTERKAEKLALQTKENKERFKFLQSKLKSSFSLRKTKKEQRRPELDEAIEDYKNGNVETYANFEEYKKAMNAL